MVNLVPSLRQKRTSRHYKVNEVNMR